MASRLIRAVVVYCLAVLRSMRIDAFRLELYTVDGGRYCMTSAFRRAFVVPDYQPDPNALELCADRSE